MAGFQPLTADDAYSLAKGFGWEGVKPQSIEFQNPGPLRPHTRPREVDFDENLTDLNRDAVKSTEDLILRVDVPNGRYRVRLLFGDMTQAVGSVDVHVNGKLAATRATAWTPGGYRSFIRDPYGWWAPIRHTAVVDDGMIRIRLSKNQSYYDEQMAEQSTLESPFKIWWPAAKNIPPYSYIGYAFIHNSLMTVEIAPLVRPPVIRQDGRLKLIAEIDSPALRGAISSFNIGDLDAAAASLAQVTEPDAQVAKAVVALWLAGHPDVEMEKTLVPGAIEILRQHVRVHPEETVLAEHLQDAEYFQKALTTHLTRGHLADDKGRGKNHFIENDRAIGWWWLIGEDSPPLLHFATIHRSRGAHAAAIHAHPGHRSRDPQEAGKEVPQQPLRKVFAPLGMGARGRWEPIRGLVYGRLFLEGKGFSRLGARAVSGFGLLGRLGRVVLQVQAAAGRNHRRRLGR